MVRMSHMTAMAHQTVARTRGVRFPSSLYVLLFIRL